MSIDLPHMLIFVGPTPSDKIIRIIKEDDHYDGCNPFSGFLSKSYFCDECNRGYDHDDREHHPCEGKWCHLVIERTAQISQKLKNRWVQENFLHPLGLAVCVIDPFLVKTVTLTIFIVALKTFHPSVTLTKNVLSVARPMRQNQEKEVTEGIEDPEIISAVGANATSVNNKCTSPPINVTSNAFQKRRMIPN